MDEPVLITPNLSRTNRMRPREAPVRATPAPKKAERAVDPDVEQVMRERNRCDVTKMKHEPTEEEQKSEEKEEKEGEKSSRWTWVVIALTIIVVLLMVAIAWYVLKINREKSEESIPQQVVQPRSIPQQMMSAASRTANRIIRPVKAAAMPVASHEMPAKKSELQETLGRLANIPEDDEKLPPPPVSSSSAPKKKLRPSKKQKRKETQGTSSSSDSTTAESTEDLSDNIELDEKVLDKQMAEKFNQAILDRVEMSDEEDEEEENVSSDEE